MELRLKMISYVILACKKSRPRNHSCGSRPVTQYQNLVELHYHCHHKHHNNHQYHHFHLDWLPPPPPPITKMTPSTPHLCQIWWREVVASHQETSCAVRKHHRDTAMAVAGLEVAKKLKFRILKHVISMIRQMGPNFFYCLYFETFWGPVTDVQPPSTV